MKTIGQSEGRDEYIVIMSSMEHKALEKLARVVEGESLDRLSYEPRFMGENTPDLANTLNAIRLFANALDRANELSGLIEGVKRELTKGDDARH